MNGANLVQPVRDRLGRFFDALKFRRGPDGQPRFDVLGRFVNLRGGRKPKFKMPTIETPPAEAAPASPPSPAVTAPDPAAAPEPVPEFLDVKRALGSMPANENESPAAADVAAELSEEIKNLGENPTAESVIGLIQTGLILIGEEEGILTPTEKIILRRPLLRLLAKYNVGSDALPAEIDLALCVLGLIAARMQKPKTAGFVLKVKAWIVGLFFKSEGKKLAETLRDNVGSAVKGGAS